MKKQTLLKRATAAALLSATLAAPAVIGLTAGTASARPIDNPNCAEIGRAYQNAYYMAEQARDQGDVFGVIEWMRDANRAQLNYKRSCLS